MTDLAYAITVKSLTVGAGGTAYAASRFERSVRVEGVEQATGVSYRHERWTATCHARAATVNDVAALWTTIRGHICQRGARVTITDHTGTRVLPEYGVPEGVTERSIAGYPRVSMAEVPDQCYGVWLTFTVEAETIVPIVGGGDLVEHDYTIEESEDDGLERISQRGRVRMKNGVVARTWLDSEVIDAAKAAATTTGRTWRVRYTQGLDTSLVEYEFSAAERGGGGAGLSQAEVMDVTVRTGRGRISRTVSGSAKGAGAAAWAASQKPTPGTYQIFVREQVSQPRVPDGRVDFTYELLTGAVHPDFGGVVFGLRESIVSTPIGREASLSVFLDGVPIIRGGAVGPHVVVQSTEIEFIGPWSGHGIAPLLDESLLQSPPAVMLSGGEFGLRRAAATYTFVSETEIEGIPDPRELEPFL